MNSVIIAGYHDDPLRSINLNGLMLDISGNRRYQYVTVVNSARFGNKTAESGQKIMLYDEGAEFYADQVSDDSNILIQDGFAKRYIPISGLTLQMTDTLEFVATPRDNIFAGEDRDDYRGLWFCTLIFHDGYTEREDYFTCERGANALLIHDTIMIGEEYKHLIIGALSGKVMCSIIPWNTNGAEVALLGGTEYIDLKVVDGSGTVNLGYRRLTQGHDFDNGTLFELSNLPDGYIDICPSLDEQTSVSLIYVNVFNQTTFPYYNFGSNVF